MWGYKHTLAPPPPPQSSYANDYSRIPRHTPGQFFQLPIGLPCSTKKFQSFFRITSVSRNVETKGKVFWK